MTVKEALTAWGVTPEPDYQGQETADDFILGVKTESTGQETPDKYTVVQNFVSEHSAALNAQSVSNTYIRTGPVDTKTSTQRQFTINGDRFAGDPFQDFALSHKIKYSSGQSVVVDYVWFSSRTGKGEKGRAALIVNSDASGAAGNNAGFSANLNAIGTPEEYTYTDSEQLSLQTASAPAEGQSIPAEDGQSASAVVDTAAETPVAPKKTAS